MKKLQRAILVVLSLALIFSLASCGGSSASTPAPSAAASPSATSSVNEYGYDLSGIEPMTLVATSALATSHCCWAGFYEPYIALVEEMSSGLITFETYNGGELVEGGKEYDALRDGVADVAMPLTPIYDTSRFPAGDVGQLPVKISDSLTCSNAYVDLLASEEAVKDGKTFNQAYFEDNGVHFIAHNNPPGNSLATTKKDITAMTDYTGLLIRTSSRPQQFLAPMLGMTPVNIAVYDLYDALSRGTADGGFQQIPDWATFGLDEIYKYAIEGLSFGHFTAGMGFNSEKWNNYPAVVQQILTDAADQVRDAGCQYWEDKTTEVKATVEGNGGNFVNFNDLDPALQEKINNACVETWRQYIEMLEKAGEPGAEICKLWRDCMVANGAEMIDGVDQVLDEMLAQYSK